MLKSIKNNRFAFYSLCIVFSALSAFLGAVLAGYYLLDIWGGLILSDGNLNAGRETPNLIFREGSKVIVDQDEKIGEVIDQAGKSYLGIYKKIKNTPASEEEGVSDFIAAEYYDLNKPLGTGFSLTSDGWIITTLDLDEKTEYVAVSRDKKIFEIESIANGADPDFSYVRVKARDLSVSGFSAGDRVRNGQSIMAVSWTGKGWKSMIVDSGANSAGIMSSDSYDRKITVNSAIPKEFSGTAVYDLAGYCVGLIDNAGNIRSISNFIGPIKSLLKNGRPDRPSLGIHYMNLAFFADPERIADPKGALLTGDTARKAVLKGSPAEAAGLKEGDIIISIDNTAIDQHNDIAAKLQDHVPGDRILVGYIRDEKAASVEITLGAVNEL